MPGTQTAQIDVAEAAKLISNLQAEAKKVLDERIKKILLAAGCEIADLFLDPETLVAQAA